MIHRRYAPGGPITDHQAVAAAISLNPTAHRLGVSGGSLIARPNARPALLSWLEEEGTLIDAAAAHPEAETLHGRGRVFSVPAPVGRGKWVVRHYRRGGAMARLLGDRYLRLGTPRPVREFLLGRALDELDIPTPAHVGVAVYPQGPWYRGDLVTERVPNSIDLAAVLFPDAAARPCGDRPIIEPAGAMAATGRLIRLLHDRGMVHPDLHLKNIVLTGHPPRALVVDLDKARIRSRVNDRSRRRMLDRFWRSARKWEGRAGSKLADGLRRAFERGYDEG